MYFSEKLGLAIAGHRDIDFIDINLDTDTELYIDPTLVDGLPTRWCSEAKAVIADFFDNVFECCRTKNHKRLYELVAFGKEPNETKLGLSIEQSQGKGSKPENLYRILKTISDECLIEKGIVKNPSELCVFVNNFAEDRMSDLITNIIRKQLYDFTVQQCLRHRISLANKPIIIGQTWDATSKKWVTLTDVPLMIDDRKTLLVPKIIVRRKYIVSAAQYIQKHVLTHRQEYHLEKRTSMSHQKYSKKRGYYYVAPSKKEVYAKEIKGKDHKNFVRDFAERNPEIVDEFRKRQVREKDMWGYVLSDSMLDHYVYQKRAKSA